MKLLTTYIPIDRCRAIIDGTDLPDCTEGAALFADISGFTPLTESLLRTLGARRGAEELTQQLNMVYNALIAEVYRYQGTVIGFSGDAITCWMDGDDGRRATACALAMQQAMTRFAALPTPSGETVSLAMKAAIATGPVRRFVVGDPKIQYIDVLAGATLDRMGSAEGQAERGEIVLDPQTATLLNKHLLVSAWRSGQEGAAPFAVVSGLAHTVPDMPWTEIDASVLNREQVRPWIMPPVYERLQVGQEQFLAEIRPAVALFLRFGGIDYDHDPGAGNRLDAYIRWVQNVLARYEGYLLQLTMGDKGSYLYAAFGAPIAHDDDSARAVAAALDLMDLPPELAYIRGLQIGISRGTMRAGAYGSTRRHTYGVLGDEVNLAARLMMRAQPGHILVSGRIAYNTSHLYNLRSIGLVPVRGKQDPVPVSLVLGRKQPSLLRAAIPFASTLVGRERELHTFDTVLERVLAGTGQILRMEGVAGVGKSHLCAAFDERAQQQHMRVLLGACQSISQTIAYAPWRQIFWVLFGLPEAPDTSTQEQHACIEAELARLNPDWLLRLPLLGDLLGLPLPDNSTTAAFEPRLRQDALFTLVVDLLQAWAHEHPLLLLLEDAHWMDEASLGLTLAVCRVFAQMPVLLLLVHRPPTRDDDPLLPDLFALPNHHHLSLNELSPEAVTALIHHRLQGQTTFLTQALIQAQAQGNPFFIEELVDALRETGKLVCQDDGVWTLSDQVINALSEAQCLTRSDTGGWTLIPDAPLSAADLGIPDSVHGVVLSRIDRLPEEHKLTLKVASVIGRIFELDVLAQIHPARVTVEALQEQIRMAEARDFTRLEVPQPRLAYIFKHSVTQEVAYSTLLESQQRNLHRAVGETLERLQPDAVEKMAYHFSRSGVRDKTLIYLEKAAYKAQREYASETALSYYVQALALEERWEWRRGQVEILHTLGRREEQHAALQALDAVASAPRFVTGSLWGHYYEIVGNYEQARQSVVCGLADCRSRGDRTSEARCLAQLGSIAYRQGEYEQAMTSYTQARELFERGTQAAQTDEDGRTLVAVLNGLGSVYLQQGSFEQARTCCEQALQVSHANGNKQGEADVLNNLGAMFFYERRFAEALTHYRQALVLHRAIGDRAGEGAILGNMAQVFQIMGDYAQASDYLSSALAIQQAIGNRWNEINNWNDLGLLYQELGKRDRAQACLQRGLQLSQEIGDEAGQAYILANLGLVALDGDNVQAAEQMWDNGLQLAKGQDDRYLVAIFLSYLGVVNLRVHNLDRAIEQSAEALALRQELDLRMDTTYNLATLAMAHLLRGEHTLALTYTHQALTILDECGGEGPEFPQRDYFLCSQVLDAAGEAGAAQRALQAASTLVTARAEKIVDPSLRMSFLEQVPINRQIVQAARH